MDFLYFLQSIRNPVFDAFFSAVTHLGEELIFLAAAIIIFWCIDKFEGYYIMAVGFIGTVLNQFLKIFFRIPRPWVLDKNFPIVESARAEATGYSFPSGHTQSFIGTAGSVALWNKNKWLRIALGVLMLLVPFSRMYLGVHTPLDVGVSFALGIILVILLKPIINKAKSSPKFMYILIGFMLLIALGNLLFCELYNFPKDVDAENYASALKNAYKLFGCILGLPIVYFLDSKFIKFKTDGSFLFQIFKIVIGLALVLGVKEGAKPLLKLLLGDLPVANGIRYFFVVLAAGALWPFVFTKLEKYFKRKEKCKQEK